MKSSHATKSCVLILLVALLCAEKAQGLECYNCLWVPHDTSCSSSTCPYSNGYCVSQEADYQGGKIKNKMCLPICTESTQSTNVLDTTVTVKTSCCKENLCNAAVPTRDSTWTMAGLLLVSLGSVLLQILL